MRTEGAAHRAFALLHETRLLVPALPEVALLKGVQQPPEYHPEGDVWLHTLLMLEKLNELPAHARTMTLAWGVLLHDIGKPATFRSAAETGDRIRFDGHAEVGVRIAEEICRRLRFSNEATEQVMSLVANHMRFKDVQNMRESTLKRFVRLPGFEEHLALHRLDFLYRHADLAVCRGCTAGRTTKNAGGGPGIRQKGLRTLEMRHQERRRNGLSD